MAETPPPPSSEPSTPPSSAADQARIRKERREAKIRAGGSARLNKITGVGGGVQKEAPPQPTVSEPEPRPSYTADPDEVDISHHFAQPAGRPRALPPQHPDAQLSDAQLRAMMLGFPAPGSTSQHPSPPPPSLSRPPAAPGANPFFPGMAGTAMGPGGAADDPMLKLLQQMMGRMGGAAGGPQGGLPGMPPLPAGLEGAAPATHATAAAAGDPHAYLWRIVHAVFALALGLYVALAAEFTGSKLARDGSALARATGGAGAGADGGVGSGSGGWEMDKGSLRFFYIFATAEVVLQTCRFYVEKGTVQQGGVLGMVVGFLPQPWRGYLALLMRYGRIWTTTSGDALVCVFVLGVCSWLRAQ